MELDQKIIEKINNNEDLTPEEHKKLVEYLLKQTSDFEFDENLEELKIKEKFSFHKDYVVNDYKEIVKKRKFNLIKLGFIDLIYEIPYKVKKIEINNENLLKILELIRIFNSIGYIYYQVKDEMFEKDQEAYRMTTVSMFLWYVLLSCLNVELARCFSDKINIINKNFERALELMNDLAKKNLIDESVVVFLIKILMFKKNKDIFKKNETVLDFNIGMDSNMEQKLTYAKENINKILVKVLSDNNLVISDNDIISLILKYKLIDENTTKEDIENNWVLRKEMRIIYENLLFLSNEDMLYLLKNDEEKKELLEYLKRCFNLKYNKYYDENLIPEITYDLMDFSFENLNTLLEFIWRLKKVNPELSQELMKILVAAVNKYLDKKIRLYEPIKL